MPIPPSENRTHDVGSGVADTLPEVDNPPGEPPKKYVAKLKSYSWPAVSIKSPEELYVLELVKSLRRPPFKFKL